MSLNVTFKWNGCAAPCFYFYYTLLDLRCQVRFFLKAGQQHLKLSEKNIEKTQWIQGSGKALFLDTESAAEISVSAKGQSGFT